MNDRLAQRRMAQQLVTWKRRQIAELRRQERLRKAKEALAERKRQAANSKMNGRFVARKLT